MNDIEAAIEEWEYCINNSNFIKLPITRQSILIILQALKAQAESEKGCEYCNGWAIESTVSFISNPPDGSDTTDVYFSYCPNCGRKLGGDERE